MAFDAILIFLLCSRRNKAKKIKTAQMPIIYNHQGILHKYYPDFIVKLTNGTTLVLETKGKDDEQNRTKRAFLDEWCRAINNHGGFGKWIWRVSFNTNDLEETLLNLVMIK